MIRRRRRTLPPTGTSMSGYWTQYGAAFGDPPWTDDRVKVYPSQAAKTNDTVWSRGAGVTEVAREMYHDRPMSGWKRTWRQDRKGLRGEHDD